MPNDQMPNYTVQTQYILILQAKNVCKSEKNYNNGSKKKKEREEKKKEEKKGEEKQNIREEKQEKIDCGKRELTFYRRFMRKICLRIP